MLHLPHWQRRCAQLTRRSGIIMCCEAQTRLPGSRCSFSEHEPSMHRLETNALRTANENRAVGRLQGSSPAQPTCLGPRSSCRGDMRQDVQCLVLVDQRQLQHHWPQTVPTRDVQNAFDSDAAGATTHRRARYRSRPRVQHSSRRAAAAGAQAECQSWCTCAPDFQVKLVS